MKEGLQQDQSYPLHIKYVLIWSLLKQRACQFLLPSHDRGHHANDPFCVCESEHDRLNCVYDHDRDHACESEYDRVLPLHDHDRDLLQGDSVHYQSAVSSFE